MKNIYVFMLISAIYLLSGCSSTSSQDLVKEQLAMDKLRQDYNKERQEIEQQHREEEINILPQWVLTPLQSDQTGFYAVGMAESKSLFFVMKKAKMQAEFELAKQYRQFLSGAERSFERENGNGELQIQTTVLIDKLIDEVPIVGYDMIKQKVIAINGMHTAYVLLKMPYEQYNKVLQAQRANQTEVTVAKAFDDLQHRLKVRRDEMQQVKAIDQQQSIEKEQQRNQLLIDTLNAKSEKADIVSPDKSSKN